VYRGKVRIVAETCAAACSAILRFGDHIQPGIKRLRRKWCSDNMLNRHTMSAESQQKRYKAVGSLLAAAMLWSLGGLLIKQVSWNPAAIAGTRSAIAGGYGYSVCGR